LLATEDCVAAASPLLEARRLAAHQPRRLCPGRSSERNLRRSGNLASPCFACSLPTLWTPQRAHRLSGAREGLDRPLVKIQRWHRSIKIATGDADGKFHPNFG